MPPKEGGSKENLATPHHTPTALVFQLNSTDTSNISAIRSVAMTLARLMSTV